MATLKYIPAIALALLAMGSAATLSSCSEDSVYNVDPVAVPQASDYVDNFNITVDQNTNIATFTFAGTGVYPVWIIDGKSYSSSVSFTRYYRKAGVYSVEMKVGNANGISTGTITKEFTIDRTMMTGFGGYVYDSPYNLWKTATKKTPTFYYAPGWSQIADPSYSFDGDAYTVTLNAATTDQWQAQMHIGTDISLTEGNHYDGSFIFTATKDINNITLKIHPDGDDDDSHSFFPNKKINLKAGEPTTFWFSDLAAAVDMNNLVFTLDFGGCPEGIEVTVENFVLKDHANDDGTVLPELPATPEPVWVDGNSADNFWSVANYTNSFYYAPGWSQIADPVLTFNGRDFTVDLPAATSDQWQAQVAFNTDLSAPDTSALYDFKVTFTSNTDLPGVMVKLVQTDEGETKHDTNFFFAETVKVPAETPTTFWVSGVSAPEAMHAISLVLDFGGCAENTVVEVTDIIFQAHHD